jgi:5S rRNA maturation endonuclease (ribonuclease M5)
MRQLTMKDYIKHQQIKYQRTKKRQDKIEILNEFCDLTGVHRKHAGRILNHRIIGWREKPLGRKKIYDYQSLAIPLKRIWLSTDQMCSKRLEIAIPLWLPYYEEEYGALAEEIKAQLLQIRRSTIDEILKTYRKCHPKRLGGTKPGSLLKQHIPIKTDQWDEKVPGFIEGDTVAHCGTSLMGNFIWSITVTDICTGWTENRATWNKGYAGVLEQIRSIESYLPFEILGWDSDNGGEFLNYHLLRYFQKRDKPVQVTRSRPYHSGDNAHVEQKNWTHVRQLFGYYRLSEPKLVKLMNELYTNELSDFHNFFCPSMKLVDKQREQSKIKKKYDKPLTPYQRLVINPHISEKQKEKLKEKFRTLNPFKLKKAIERKLKIIFSYVDLKIRKKVISI